MERPAQRKEDEQHAEGELIAVLAKRREGEGALDRDLDGVDETGREVGVEDVEGLALLEGGEEGSASARRLERLSAQGTELTSSSYFHSPSFFSNLTLNDPPTFSNAFLPNVLLGRYTSVSLALGISPTTGGLSHLAWL